MVRVMFSWRKTDRSGSGEAAGTDGEEGGGENE